MVRDLSRIQTIAVVMMENRSFDHILGYLGLPEFGHPNASRIEGIQHAQLYYAHDPHPPIPLQSATLRPDPPHEREDVDIQINGNLAGPMRGFVRSYERACDPSKPRARLTGVMEYCTKSNIPTTDFLARTFAICDNWFACLPASTLPNRLMAMSGYSLVDHTPDGYLKSMENFFYNRPDDLLYDWLDRRGISWRIYYSGTFFFMQLPRLFAKYQADVQSKVIFRPIDRLKDDCRNGDVPQVVFIEPRYQDDPRRGSAQATDDHAPASLWGGQRFLKIVYEALTINKSVWDGLVAIITYDEHGSFFDHVRPPGIRTKVPPGARYTEPFETLGVRVPAIVVSPFVQSGSVYEGVLDHTSILKFIGERFGDGKYTELVDSRKVGSVSEALNADLLASATVLANPPGIS